MNGTRRRLSAHQSGRLQAALLGSILALAFLIAAGYGPARLLGALIAFALLAAVVIEWNSEP